MESLLIVIDAEDELLAAGLPRHLGWGRHLAPTCLKMSAGKREALDAMLALLGSKSMPNNGAVLSLSPRQL
jgi:hypothetical protein